MEFLSFGFIKILAKYLNYINPLGNYLIEKMYFRNKKKMYTNGNSS